MDPKLDCQYSIKHKAPLYPLLKRVNGNWYHRCFGENYVPRKETTRTIQKHIINIQDGIIFYNVLMAKYNRYIRSCHNIYGVNTDNRKRIKTTS